MKGSQERERENSKVAPQNLKHQLWVISLSVIGVIVGFRYLLPPFFPFLIAYIIARIIMPVVFFLKKRLHFPLVISSILTLIATLTVLGGGLFYLCIVILRQLKNFINDLPGYVKAIANSLESICGGCDHIFGWEDGQASKFLNDNMNSVWDMIKEMIMPVLSEHTINLLFGLFAIVSLLLIISIAIINLILDYEELKEKYHKTDLYKVISPVTEKLSKVGFAYLKTQLVIMSINSLILVAGFMWTGNPYSVLAGVGIAVMDAFPVLGMGLFLIPMVLLNLLKARYFTAAVILGMFIICEVIRSFIEPRMLGGKIGLPPFFTLMAMFVGFRLFGILGFLAGPVGLIIVKTIVEENARAKDARESRTRETIEDEAKDR